MNLYLISLYHLKGIDYSPIYLLGGSGCIIGGYLSRATTDFDYYIAGAAGKETPAELVEYVVPECTWAIFECVGAMPNALQDLQKRIVSEWLPVVKKN